GIVPVRAAEAVQQDLSLGVKSKYRSPAITAAVVGCAVEIAGAIEDQGGFGMGPVRAAAEVMQHLLRPGSTRCGRQLEHRPCVVSTAALGRAVERSEEHTSELQSLTNLVCRL